MMPHEDQYWVGQWIDALDIRSPEQLRNAINDGATLKLARDLASGAELPDHELQLAAAERARDERPTRDDVLVAARPFDLSGLMNCPHEECLRASINTLFARCWHYFDTMIVEGAPPGHFAFELDRNSPSRGVRWTLEQHGLVYLYLRESGALPHLEFRPKPSSWCTNHYAQAARVVGLAPMLEEARRGELHQRLAREATIDIELAKPNWL